MAAVERLSASEPGAWSNSYLISDGQEALLFDVFQLRSDAGKLADSSAASGKKLSKVWISHAHPDHFLQLDLIVDRFPDVEVLTTPNVLDDLKADGPWMFDLLKGKLGPEAPERLIEPTAIDGQSLSVGEV
jgi:glyoxylase-like metal-dependent hydrolase (beta-lactamase superfamily II)